MITVQAADPGEALLEIAAFDIGSDHFGDDRTVEAIVPGKSLVVHLLEPVEVIGEQSILRRIRWLTRVINRGRIPA